MDTYTIWMLVVVVAGYLLIAFEHVIWVNKAVSALLMGIICWMIEFSNEHVAHIEHVNIFGEHLARISELVLFFIAVMAIAEMINQHNGYNQIARVLQRYSGRKLCLVTGVIAYSLSILLGSISTAVVMISIVGHLFDKKHDRWMLGGLIVIAANAGGAWSVMGDLTTTMLWFGQELTPFPVAASLFIPSLLAFFGSLFAVMFNFQIEGAKKEVQEGNRWMLPLGLVLLFLVPMLNVFLGLPPFMGALLALAVIWCVSDSVGVKEEKKTISSVIWQIDLSGAVFFLGILLTVDALQTAGVLEQISEQVVGWVRSPFIGLVTGILAAVFNGVPLVAGYEGMFSFNVDDSFWHMVTYSAGVGGSLIIYGSAPGVALMGLQGVDFTWFFRRMTFPALIGFILGLLWNYTVLT